MRMVFGLVLMLGLGLAGFAVHMIKGYLDQQQAIIAAERNATADRRATVEVVGVGRPLPYGTVITRADLKPIRYTTNFLPEGTFADLEELFPEGEDVPRIVLRPMEPNEPVLASKITTPGGDAGISTRLSAGMRAFAISVNATSGVSGFLRPGDRVDVYWTGSVSNSEDRREVTKLIETGLELVGVDQTAEQGRTEAIVARTVTVQVTPEQAAKLAQAQSTGSLALSLVGLFDDKVAQAVEVDQRSLLGIIPEAAPQVAAAPPEPEVCSVRTRRGAEVVEIAIPCTN
ncbi:Flp pilus assembly protein CpaB [Limimaricola litoreus]|uniref:Flp pilus assembly protein CpaB n=1 Tax=Limimaricola litoreus TaxID=2955316 RepID=A0A9X2FP66_9RHOB|nr:Flp pilus assembly protein CpaB [Limimaricola litoreus]MCP1169057.1 Flp pilus assembly protein CpaB [Limimaricola litoreus]